MKKLINSLVVLMAPAMSFAGEHCDEKEGDSCLEVIASTGWFEMGATTVSIPIHMPNLITQMGGMDIEADVKSLAKNADSFFALGVRQDFRIMDVGMFTRVEGWNGSYSMESGLSLGKGRTDLNVDIGLSLEQQIVTGDIGVFLFENWHKLSLAATIGVRSYKQDMIISIAAETSKAPHEKCKEDCVPKVTPILDEDFALLSNWTEATLGLEGAYAWSKRNNFTTLLSYGDGDSYRVEVKNTYTFDNGFLVGVGGRRDDFVSDGVPVREQGFLLELGYTF